MFCVLPWDYLHCENCRAWNRNLCSQDWKFNHTLVIFILLSKAIFPWWFLFPYVPKREHKVSFTNQNHKRFTKCFDSQGRTLGLAKWADRWPYLPMSSQSVKRISKHCPNAHVQTNNMILTPCLVQSVVQYQLVWSFQIWSQWCVDGDISWTPHTIV